MKYRVFVEDVGPNRFSGVRDTTALSPGIAVRRYGHPVGSATWYGKKLIALPHDRKDLWPDGKTGKVPAEALKYC